MIDLGGYSFQRNKAAIVCKHVLEGDPVLLFAHDDDGDIHFMCGRGAHALSDALVLGLGEMEKRLSSMVDLPIVRPGHSAERSGVGEPWTPKCLSDGN